MIKLNQAYKNLYTNTICIVRKITGDFIEVRYESGLTDRLYADALRHRKSTYRIMYGGRPIWNIHCDLGGPSLQKISDHHFENTPLNIGLLLRFKGVRHEA